VVSFTSWLQNPSQTNGDYLSNVRPYTSRTFRNKNIRDLCREISQLKKGYEPKTNLVKYGNGDLFANSHSVLQRWKNYSCQLLNVHGMNNVRQTNAYR
jgi:hypothetical protein